MLPEMKKALPVLLMLLMCLLTIGMEAQDRFAVIEARLNEIKKDVPGLDDKVELSVNGVSIQDFIRGMAASNNLNVSVDPGLNTKIYNNFTNVTVSDVLVFLCKKYDLDISFIGTIMSFVPYAAPPKEIPKYVPKPLRILYQKDSSRLSFDLFNDTLSLVAKELSRLTQRNMVLSPELNNKVVSGYIQNMALDAALNKLAFANDLIITPSDNGSFLFEKQGKNDPKQNKSYSGGPLPNGLNIDVGPDGLITVDAVNIPILDILNAVSEKSHRNYFLFTEPKGNTTLTVANASYEQFLDYLLNGTDYTYKNENNIYLVGDRNLERLRATKVFQLKYRTLDKVIDLVPTELKKGVEMKGFPDQNSIVMCGSEPRIDEITSFLLEIDQLVPLVVIEVIILDVQNSKTLSTGIEMGLGNKPTATTGTVYPGLDLSLNANTINELISGINGLGILNLGNVTPNFYLTLKALETQGVLRLRSTPKLGALNGTSAKLSIGQTQYYLERQSQTVGVQNPIPVTSEKYTPVTADLSVVITPYVSGDEQITMDVSVKQSSFTQRISPTAPPGTITRDFQSMIRVKNGETVILGGLEENSDNETGSGLPLLSRIPILKWIFSSRTRTHSRNKLTILIKATIVN
jgi:type IV pilus assembly protein PilQ